jgi:hypothetical protein
MADRDRRVREVAYRLWEDEGRPDGRDAEHWRRALTLVEAEEALALRSDPPPPPEAKPQSPLPPAARESRVAAAPAEPIPTNLAAGEATDQQNAAPPKRSAPARGNSPRTDDGAGAGRRASR